VFARLPVLVSLLLLVWGFVSVLSFLFFFFSFFFSFFLSFFFKYVAVNLNDHCSKLLLLGGRGEEGVSVLLVFSVQ